MSVQLESSAAVEKHSPNFKMMKFSSLILPTLLVLCLEIHSSQAVVSTGDFFPYGLDNGDTSLRPSNLDDGSSPRIPIGQYFSFFNESYDALWLNINGAISFKQAISQYTPICHAVPQEYRSVLVLCFLIYSNYNVPYFHKYYALVHVC